MVSMLTTRVITARTSDPVISRIAIRVLATTIVTASGRWARRLAR
jgi:hypothetical protein